MPALSLPDQAATKARALVEAELNARVDVVRTLAAAVVDVDEAERALKIAVVQHERAWAAALTAGWTEKDLRATGVRAPHQGARRARRTSPAGRGPEEVTASDPDA